MPPPSRESASLDPASRGSRYCSCASSTCSWPFARARAPREDVENQLGAIDDAPAAAPLRGCAPAPGVSSLSTMTSVDAGFVAGERERLGLAAADERRRIGARAVPATARSTTSAPAARARPASSSRMMSGSTDREARVTSPTSAARSRGRLVRSSAACCSCLRAILARGSTATAPVADEPRRRRARIDDRRRRARRASARRR